MQRADRGRVSGVMLYCVFGRRVMVRTGRLGSRRG